VKLLFDQNISFKIVRLIGETFPESKQVNHVGLSNASDYQIFEFARTNHYTIVTFDSDFIDLSLVKGTPPKIIWFRTGNLTTNSISARLLNRQELIKNFLETDADAILELI
jgi:predicted nuclease of predicted toxin-antitoxin system